MSDKLVTDNMPLVHYIIKKYYATYTKDEDIIQSGMLGLVKAAKHYDKTKGKFSTYAAVVIRSEIANELKYRKNDKLNVSLESLREGGVDWW